MMSYMDLSGLAPRTPIEVRWVDILSECVWKNVEDLDPPPIITTRGFFIGVKTFHTKECLIMAGSLGMDNELGNTDIIPVGCIISLENTNE